MRPCLSRVGQLWTSSQVELQGQCSIQRLYSLKAYCEARTPAHCALVLLLIPLPCLMATLLIECIPLTDPRLGPDCAVAFWLRTCIFTVCVDFLVLYQCRHLIPRLPTSNGFMLASSTFGAVGATSALYGTARVIGFPVPFSIIISSPVPPMLMGMCVVPAWAGFFRRHPAEIKQLVNFCVAASMQLAMAYVYPAYAFAFVRLPRWWQIPFALLLPLIKRGVKNAINSLFRDQHDLKPYMVVLNADIYHVLFVSWCMNGAKTPLHTIFFVLMDLVETAFAIRHVQALSLELSTILKHPQPDKTTSRWRAVVSIDAIVSTGGSYSLLDLALAIWEFDKSDAGAHPGVQRFSAVRAEVPRRFSSIAALNGSQVTRDCRMSNKARAVAVEPSTSNTLIIRTATSTFVLEKHPHLSCDGSIATEINRKAQEAVTQLSASERAECLQLVLRLLHISELLLLIEFVEVIIPAVYCTC
jgi:hypothetical protein